LEGWFPEAPVISDYLMSLLLLTECDPEVFSGAPCGSFDGPACDLTGVSPAERAFLAGEAQAKEAHSAEVRDAEAWSRLSDGLRGAAVPFMILIVVATAGCRRCCRRCQPRSAGAYTVVGRSSVSSVGEDVQSPTSAGVLTLCCIHPELVRRNPTVMKHLAALGLACSPNLAVMYVAFTAARRLQDNGMVFTGFVFAALTLAAFLGVLKVSCVNKSNAQHCVTTTANNKIVVNNK
jgi:hypothetical protein